MMVSYYDIPFIVTSKAGIKNADEFEALLNRECGADEEKQHEFMCNWIKEWLKNNKLRFVVAEIWDESEMAEFMNFAADYIEAFDFGDQDIICDQAFNIGGAKIEAAEQRMILARMNQK